MIQARDIITAKTPSLQYLAYFIGACQTPFNEKSHNARRAEEYTKSRTFLTEKSVTKSSSNP